MKSEWDKDEISTIKNILLMVQKYFCPVPQWTVVSAPHLRDHCSSPCPGYISTYLSW